MAPNKEDAINTMPRSDEGVPAQTDSGVAHDRGHARYSPGGRRSGNPATMMMKNAREESARILDGCSVTLSSVTEKLAKCEKNLKSDAARRSPPPLSLLARGHKVQKLREAVEELASVIARLSASLVTLVDQGTAAEKVFTPVLINTLSKESTNIHDVSQQLLTTTTNTVAMEKDLRSIRGALVSSVDAFEPIHQAIFDSTIRQRAECDRFSAPTLEYLRDLGIDWSGLHRVEEALPVESKMAAALHRGGKKVVLDESTRRNILYPEIKYWPV